MYAFFDVDETLIRCKSMFDFLPDLHQETGFEQLSVTSVQNHLDRLKICRASREIINREYYRLFQGVGTSMLQRAIKCWFSKQVQTRSEFYYLPMLDILKQEKNQGRIPVLVSGSFKELLLPIANDLDIEIILATELERKQEIYTGNILSIQTIGKGKMLAIEDFLTVNQGDAKNCSAYGDHISDKWMLEYCGHAYIVGNDHALFQLGLSNSWSHVNPVSGKIRYLNSPKKDVSYV